VKAEGRKANGDWKTVALGDVAEFVRGINFKPDDVVPTGTPGSVACMRTKNVQAELDLSDVWSVGEQFVRREDQFLQAGDVLVSSANSWNLVGKCCWIPELPGRASFGGFVSVLRPHRAKIEPRFLFRWFSSDRIQTTLRSFGQQTTNISNLNTDRCLKLSLPLPPLAEQRRIAEVLDRAEALRAKRRAALAQLDSLTQSLFLDLFGDPVANPKGWPMIPFGDICDTRLGKMLDQKQQTGHHVRPYLRNANVQWFRFELAEVFEMDFDEKARKVFRLQDGDLLICEGGEPGRAAVWRGEIAECYYQKALHRARPRSDLAIAEFLAWQLWFLAHRGGLGDHVTSATIAHLTGEKLNAMKVPLPPIPLQREFARRVTAVEALKRAQRASLAELDALFATLQHRAFRGEL